MHAVRCGWEVSPPKSSRFENAKFLATNIKFKLKKPSLHFLQSFKTTSGTYKSPWFSKIERTLNNIGLSYLLYETEINPKWFKMTTEKRISDIFIQEWRAKVNSDASCIKYRIFKEEFCLLHEIFRTKVRLL